jgi:trk system potassium uptake protein TrkH
MKKTLLRLQKKIILHLRPTTVIVLSFFLLIMAGTLLLLLPASTRSGQSATFVEALFTATSAACVTGLVVVDTWQYWSLFGQIVILSLIQVGAFGIITFTTFFSSLLGRKMRLRSMILAQESINTFTLEGVMKLVKRVVLITLLIEAVGALLLSSRFVPQYGLKGFYLGVFHSISSFCDAGFDLMSISGGGQFLSLTQYNDDPVVLYTVSLLIIIGSLGFIVWKDLFDYRKTKALMLHSKLVLSMSAFLILSGSLLFFLFESGNRSSMGGMDLAGRINASIFQAITTRTAGYNSIDLNGITDISKLLSILLMFIGAAPGSTAGGIKVTTFGILVFAVISQIKGSDEIIIFRRRVAYTTVSKALAIFGLSAALIFIVSAVIHLIENQQILDILFEVTSAFGTVGQTTGLTPDLHLSSKLLLVLMMFLGRVGPVTFALALTIRSHKNTSDLVYPEGRVIVG